MSKEEYAEYIRNQVKEWKKQKNSHCYRCDSNPSEDCSCPCHSLTLRLSGGPTKEDLSNSLYGIAKEKDK